MKANAYRVECGMYTLQPQPAVGAEASREALDIDDSRKTRHYACLLLQVGYDPSVYSD